MRVLAITPLAALLAGCAYTTLITDSIGIAEQRIAVTASTDTTVTFHTSNDQPGVWIAEIRPRVIEGDIYLSCLKISSPVHRTDFVLDFGSAQYPSDWKRRLYWVEGESFTAPLDLFHEHVHEIQRRKIDL